MCCICLSLVEGLILDQFKVATAIPVAYSFLVLADLPATCSNIVLDEVRTQIFSGDFAALKQIGGFSEVAGQSANVTRFQSTSHGVFVVGIAIEAAGEFQL